MSTDVFEITDPDLLADNDPAPLRCGVDGCTNPMVKPARGRTPKYCDEHKGQRATTHTPSRSKASGKSWTQAAAVETYLNSLVTGAAGITKRFNEFDGFILEQNGPAVVKELVELAKDDKQLQRYLTYLASPGKYGPLVMACGSLILPIAMNHNFFGLLSLFGFKDNDENEGRE